MTCLLCRESLSDTTYFLDIVLLKRKKATICPTCRSKFEEIAEAHCPTCFKSGTNQICKDCLFWQSQGEKVHHFALYRYNAAMKDYMSQFKFMGDYCLGEIFSKEIKSALSDYRDYCIVPIPMDTNSLDSRGYNQVETLLDFAGISYQQLFGKEKVEKQSSKSRQDRLSGVNPFYLREFLDLPDKILLVDDVYTTGATLKHAKTLLKQAGCSTIRTFSLAR
ncbi:ComF family protein [Streptococcus saliviloxodontae]|uniref:Competence protein ComFC n=1 Tax=Streptococcus saliviloxodontae TaxID=1349416 RepID=A0ABS2PNS8_9STRE|nr:ComF family protein [Streptococcus saliviloxodontae]MBM7637084.1 competence protein ComFC [Streptococcus saliviloxodontae]